MVADLSNPQLLKPNLHPFGSLSQYQLLLSWSHILIMPTECLNVDFVGNLSWNMTLKRFLMEHQRTPGCLSKPLLMYELELFTAMNIQGLDA